MVTWLIFLLLIRHVEIGISVKTIVEGLPKSIENQEYLNIVKYGSKKNSFCWVKKLYIHTCERWKTTYLSLPQKIIGWLHEWSLQIMANMTQVIKITNPTSNICLKRPKQPITFNFLQTSKRTQLEIIDASILLLRPFRFGSKFKTFLVFIFACTLFIFDSNSEDICLIPSVMFFFFNHLTIIEDEQINKIT